MSEVVVVSRVFAADVDDVWKVITDIDHFPEVYSSMIAVTRLKGADYGVGTTWEETRRVMGGSLRQTLECLEMKDRSHTIQRAHSKVNQAQARRDLSAVPGGTRMTISIEVIPNRRRGWARLFGGAVSVISTTVIQEILERDLQDIEGALSKK